MESTHGAHFMTNEAFLSRAQPVGAGWDLLFGCKRRLG